MREGERPVDSGPSPSGRAPASPPVPSPAGHKDGDGDGVRSAAERHAESELRRADRELVQELALSGFRGPAWDLFAHELARYGLSVITGWLASDELFRRAKIANVPLRKSLTVRSEHDLLSIADDVVAHALFRFRERALLAGEWDYNKSSLKTYFIGQCILECPNAYRRWTRETERADRLMDDAIYAIVENLIDSENDPAHTVVERITAANVVADITDERLKVALLLRARGHPNPEIAEIMQTTKGTVEGLLHRHRARLQARAPQGDDHER